MKCTPSVSPYNLSRSGGGAVIVAPDETTFKYIKDKKFAPKGASWEKAVQYWKTLPSDASSKFDKEVIIDVSQLEPMVTWGTNPEQAAEISKSIPKLSDFPETSRSGVTKALNYIQLTEGQKLDEVPLEWAFIGSCTNGRIEDLRIAAQVLKGRKISSTVTMYVVPGSEEVMAQAKAEGLDKIFEDSGAQFRMPGCSMCLGMNDDLVPPGKRCISSSNRNFAGRQGPGSLTHLASPATVAASAIEGKITTAARYL